MNKITKIFKDNYFNEKFSLEYNIYTIFLIESFILATIAAISYSGVKRVIIIALQMICYLGCIIISYLKPELVVPINSALIRADSYLYETKETGRNKVVSKDIEGTIIYSRMKKRRQKYRCFFNI